MMETIYLIPVLATSLKNLQNSIISATNRQSLNLKQKGEPVALIYDTSKRVNENKEKIVVD